MHPSKSLGSSVDIFTGVTNGYGPIGGFDWEQGSSDSPIQDDPNLEDYNVKSRIDQFVLECIEQDATMRTVRFL